MDLEVKKNELQERFKQDAQQHKALKAEKQEMIEDYDNQIKKADAQMKYSQGALGLIEQMEQEAKTPPTPAPEEPKLEVVSEEPVQVPAEKPKAKK